MGKSIYDCLAYIIRNVVDNTDERFYENCLAILPQKSESINQLLQEKFPEIMCGKNARNIKSVHFLDEEFVKRIEAFVEFCLVNDKMALVRLVSKIDSGLAQIIRNKKVDSNQNGVLNSNCKDQQIQLLPRCNSSWGRRNTDTASSNNLNNFMNHMYYVDVKELRELTECTVSHCFINPYDFKRAMERGKLHIGITPLSDNISLEVDTRDVKGEHGEFYVKGLCDVEELVENAVAILERAKEKEVDILCFPEMLGHPKVQKNIIERLQKFPEDDGRQYPVLTFLPSYWNANSNTVMVLDDMGNPIASQEKQFRFPYSKEGRTYMEGITPNLHIQLMHCDGIGRIAIMICKDALNREYLHNVLRILKVTLLLVPSFSTGYHDFETDLQTCSSFDCNAVWINSCSVKMLTDKEDLEVVGFVLRSGRKIGCKNGTYRMETKDCMKKKGGTCRECLFVRKMDFELEDYRET